MESSKAPCWGLVQGGRGCRVGSPGAAALCFSCANYCSAEKVFVTAPVPKYQMIACFEANLSSHLFKCLSYQCHVYVWVPVMASLELA